jgi:hypothetical protein
MEKLLRTKKLLMVLVITLMSIFSSFNVFITQTDDSSNVNNIRAYANSQINDVLDQIHLIYKGTALYQLILKYRIRNY